MHNKIKPILEKKIKYQIIWLAVFVVLILLKCYKVFSLHGDFEAFSIFNLSLDFLIFLSFISLIITLLRDRYERLIKTRAILFEQTAVNHNNEEVNKLKFLLSRDDQNQSLPDMIECFANKEEPFETGEMFSLVIAEKTNEIRLIKRESFFGKNNAETNDAPNDKTLDFSPYAKYVPIFVIVFAYLLVVKPIECIIGFIQYPQYRFIYAIWLTIGTTLFAYAVYKLEF